MAIKSADFFHLMRTAYKTGLMQKWTSISEEAAQAVINELGISSFDLIDNLDQSDPAEMEAQLARIGPWLKWLDRPLAMKAVARLLDVPAVRKRVVAKLRGQQRKQLAPAAERAARRMET